MRNCGVDWQVLRVVRERIQPPTPTEVAESQERIKDNVLAYFEYRKVRKTGEFYEICGALFRAGEHFGIRVTDRKDTSLLKNGSGKHCKLCDDGIPHSQFLHEEFIMQMMEVN